jgi:hypothetical protein
MKEKTFKRALQAIGKTLNPGVKRSISFGA